MIIHLLKQIWNEKRSNIWLWAELLVVCVFMWYVVDSIYTTAVTYYEPVGFDITDTYLIELNTKTEKSSTYIHPQDKTTTDGEDLLEIANRLKRLPEVEDVSISRNSRPYNNNNSGFRFTLDTLTLTVLQRPVTPSFFNVFRYKNIGEGGTQALISALQDGQIVVGENLLPATYKGDRRLMGKVLAEVDDSTNTHRIAAVTHKVRYDNFWSGYDDRYIAFALTEQKISSQQDVRWMEVCLRVKPGTSADFPERVMELSDSQFSVGNMFIQKVESLQDIKRNNEVSQVNRVKSNLWMIAFLLINIFLGIIGTFWFRTQQRRAELGLRLAMGSSKRRIWNMLLGENVLIFTLAAIPATLICYHIGDSDIVERWTVEWGTIRFLSGMLITTVLMLLMIVSGIWYPARQAMKIEPAEALHNE